MVLLAALAGLSGCADKTGMLPEDRPTGVVQLATSEGGCASQRAACHASGTAMPAEIAAALTAHPEAPSPAPQAPGEPKGTATVAPNQPAAIERAPAPTATNDPDSRAANENGEYVEIAWGNEVTFDEMLEMGKRGEIAEIEWYALPNAIRLITSDRQYFHVKNEKWGRSVKKEFDQIGIKTGKRGIPINFYFCN